MLKVPTTAVERSEDWQRLKRETESRRRKAQEICSSRSSGSAAESVLTLHMVSRLLSGFSHSCRGQTCRDCPRESDEDAETMGCREQSSRDLGGQGHGDRGGQGRQRPQRLDVQRLREIKAQSLWDLRHGDGHRGREDAETVAGGGAASRRCPYRGCEGRR